jgi:hypothetical protein
VKFSEKTGGALSLAIYVGFLFVVPACNARSVTNRQSETVICETLDSAMIAKETRGQMAPPQDCSILPKASWRAVVLVEGDKFEYLAVPLQDGQYRKGWASADQLYEIYPPKQSENNSATWGKMFKAQVERCWKKPYGITTHPPTARFTIRLKRDGTLEGEPVPDDTPATPYLRVYQESALRAIIECQPYKLPVADFDEWKYTALVFTE